MGNEKLKKVEEALPRVKECKVENASRLYKAKTGVGCDAFHPKVPLDLKKKTRKLGEFLEKSWSSWRRRNKVANGRNKSARRCSS